MTRMKFDLDSDQLELLLAFESNSSLSHLAALLHRDPSVVSRNIQRLAEAAPVMVKQGGKWHISPLGKQINVKTKEFLKELNVLLNTEKSPIKNQGLPSKSAALLVINAQKGIFEPVSGPRNNPAVETNIGELLKIWRAQATAPIFHVKHVSDNPASSFYRNSHGVEFAPEFVPFAGETAIEKKTAGAFTGTDLKKKLLEKDIYDIVLTGFTTHECIAATAREGFENGFRVFVIADATAAFDLTGPSGQTHKAAHVHEVTLAGLHGSVASIVKMDDFKT